MNNKLDIRDAFFGEIYRLAKKDKNLIFISDDMDAFALKKFKEEIPNQYINIGVAEQNMMDVAAGLSLMGKKVFVYGICNYITMRAYEQIRFSICSMKLPVTIIGIGAGFSFSFDGPTHHGVSDIALMRLLPEIEIYNPCTSVSARSIALKSYKNVNPDYVRIDKGIFDEHYIDTDNFNKGYKVLKRGNERLIISTGFMTHRVIEFMRQERIKQANIGLVDIFCIKPLNLKIVNDVLMSAKEIIVVEENFENGALGTVIEDVVASYKLTAKVLRVALKNQQNFVYGSREHLQRHLTKQLKLAFTSTA